MKIGADLVEVGNEIVKPCPPTKHYFEVFTIGLGFIPRNPEIFPMVRMGATLFEYTSCGRYFSNLSVTINEDTQVCEGGFKPDKFTGTCIGDSGGTI